VDQEKLIEEETGDEKSCGAVPLRKGDSAPLNSTIMYSGEISEFLFLSMK
jgi:hypothetical protein